MIGSANDLYAIPIPPDLDIPLADEDQPLISAANSVRWVAKLSIPPSNGYRIPLGPIVDGSTLIMHCLIDTPGRLTIDSSEVWTRLLESR